MPELEIRSTLPGHGPIDRLFGVLSTVEDGPVGDLLRPLLALPENRSIASRLADGALGHVPINRWIAQQLSEALLTVGLHLPFTFRPLNSDLAALLERKADLRAIGFRAYFNQGVLFEGGEIVLRRVFSLPVRGSAQGTEHDPYVDSVLDEDLGVVVEAFARPG
ncbi:MAG: hypothetical protein ABMA64_03995 [Myxococcota bacterium]